MTMMDLHDIGAQIAGELYDDQYGTGCIYTKWAAFGPFHPDVVQKRMYSIRCLLSALADGLIEAWSEDRLRAETIGNFVVMGKPAYYDDAAGCSIEFVRDDNVFRVTVSPTSPTGPTFETKDYASLRDAARHYFRILRDFGGFDLEEYRAANLAWEVAA
jgi:hypothetical protein